MGKTQKLDSMAPGITIEDPLSGFKGFVILLALILLVALSFMLYSVREELGIALIVLACGVALWLLCRGIATIYQARAMVKEAEMLHWHRETPYSLPLDITILGQTPYELEDQTK